MLEDSTVELIFISHLQERNNSRLASERVVLHTNEDVSNRKLHMT